MTAMLIETPQKILSFEYIDGVYRIETAIGLMQIPETSFLKVNPLINKGMFIVSCDYRCCVQGAYCKGQVELIEGRDIQDKFRSQYGGPYRPWIVKCRRQFYKTVRVKGK